MPSVVASINSGTFTSRTVSTGTITSWTPALNDLVVIMIQLPQSTTAPFTLPSLWFNPLGGSTVATSPSGANMVVVAHLVTQAEATAVTTAWTLTNLLDVSKQGSRVTFVIRGVNPFSPVDASAVGGGNTNSMIVPGVTPTKRGSLVVAGGGGNSFSTSATYTMPSAPWSLTTGAITGTNIRFAIQNATPTTAGAAFSGTTIGISRVDDWTAVTIAFAPINDADKFFAFF